MKTNNTFNEKLISTKSTSQIEESFLITYFLIVVLLCEQMENSFSLSERAEISSGKKELSGMGLQIVLIFIPTT